MALLRACTREIGALTYGWATPDHPDPDNVYLRAVERIKQGTYVSSNKDLKPKDMKVSAAGLAAAAASAAACGLVVPGP